ncbi:MAG: hypothetical protein COA99_14680 [Moraxellaceae bacterium]|nr:MAG: hypothetical protein COA99_14680 [Moraxellaceae bacterium]
MQAFRIFISIISRQIQNKIKNLGELIMVTFNPLVLVIDPDPLNRELLEAMLEDDMTVILGSSARECLDVFEYKHPDIVILEIDLPDMDGYTLCQQLKHRSGESGCAVIFLTEALTLEEKMDGYKHGCDEFITKPFQPEELVNIAKKTLEKKSIQRKMLNKSDTATQTAFTAMRQSSEMGLIIRFMEDSTNSIDLESLGLQFIELLKNFSLDGCLRFKAVEKNVFVGCLDGSANAQCLSMDYEKNRFISDGTALLVNHPIVSILIHDMPIADETRYGEIRDFIGIVINLIAARTQSINMEHELKIKRHIGLDSTVQQCHEKMSLINEHLASHADEVGNIMENLVTDIRGLSLTLGLSEYQETALFEKLDNTVDSMEHSYSMVTTIEAGFNSITKELSHLLLK